MMKIHASSILEHVKTGATEKDHAKNKGMA
ncbi:hypothetical protein PanWU01x14_101830 [Parasponia andersonii]|uniref:Uncharacterized protein n=1 Tax=Parasponia andersonii TaxID=3476 RepID=A0A2P5D2K1_PARAD|nr:hypothetical protein PanWU01x14_101830 [Parasponia andersonii]